MCCDIVIIISEIENNNDELLKIVNTVLDKVKCNKPCVVRKGRVKMSPLKCLQV